MVVLAGRVSYGSLDRTGVSHGSLDRTGLFRGSLDRIGACAMVILTGRVCSMI
jgi:hypothetical protein